MKRFLNYAIVCSVALMLAVAAHAAQTEIKLKDGSKWRGQATDTVEVHFMQQGVEVTMQGKVVKIDSLFIQVDGTFAGNAAKKTIYKSDIVSMKTTAEGEGAATASPAAPDASQPKADDKTSAADPKDVDTSKALGVFVLPLEGGVGEEFRHEEIDKLGAYIDKNYPPGQIIVLLINSNGGSSFETQKIGKSIAELRKKHRVVAWVKKAISAGCQTAMYCHEIYFMTAGTAGSVTTWHGNFEAIRGEELDRILEDFVRIAEENGHSRFIALAMKMNKYMCSYDKDPATGEVTFYGDLSGQYILSDENSNLCFNSSNARHCGFSDGTADTGEELAKLLNMPKWVETSDYGRKIAKEWQKTCEDANEEIPLIGARLQYKGNSGGTVEKIGTMIRLYEEAIGWWGRCHNVCEKMGLPPKEDLERQVAELRKTLADMKRRQ